MRFLSKHLLDQRRCLDLCKLSSGRGSHIEGMSSSGKENVLTLTRLGLTSVQARVYLTLAHLGVSTAKTISNASGIARQDTYRIMSVLQELGLAEKIVSSPVKFKATPMKDALPMLIRRRTEETSELQAKTQDIIKNFNVLRASLEDENLDFISAHAKELMIQKARSLEKSLDVINSWTEYVKYAAVYLGAVDRSSKNDVEVRLITNKHKDHASLPKIVQDHFERKRFEVRYIPVLPRAAVMICDKKEVFLSVNEKEGFSESPVLWSKNRCLTTVAQDYFDILWLISLKAKKKPATREPHES